MWTEGAFSARHFFHLEEWESPSIALPVGTEYTVLDTRVVFHGRYKNENETVSMGSGINVIQKAKMILEFHHLVVVTNHTASAGRTCGSPVIY